MSDPALLVPEQVQDEVLTLKLHAYPVGDVFDTASPELLVELGIKPDVRGAHRLARKLCDGLDGGGGTALEGPAVYTLVQVDGVLPGHDILQRRAGLTRLFSFGFGRLQASCTLVHLVW